MVGFLDIGKLHKQIILGQTIFSTNKLEKLIKEKY